MRCSRWGISVCTLLLVATSGFAAVPAQERAALVTIYTALDGPNWKVRANWGAAAGSECTWYGVTCDSANSTVTALDVSWNNARGVLPRDIGDLTNLVELRAGGSTISGPIPPEIGRLTKLQVLDFTGYYSNLSTANQISGPIPREIGQLSSLRELDLQGNAITGPLPSELTRLPNLEILQLNNNPVGGEIPADLLRMPKLKQLFLGATKLTGSIPSPLALPNLEILDLDANDLSGPIPPSIGLSTRLKELNLSDNRLTGPIPAEVGTLTELTTLDVYSNQLTGGLPSLANLTKLTKLVLGPNHLTGPIPPAVGNLRELKTLWLGFNDFTGDLPAELFTLSKLSDLRLSLPGVSGKLSDFTALTSLTTLVLQRASIKGPIPPDIARLGNLVDFEISGMPIGGAIPPQLGQLTGLTTLVLEDAGLTGPIPEEIGNLTQLTTLVLDGNALTSLPTSLANLNKLQVLRIERNRLRGTLPAEALGKMTALALFHAGENEFQGPIPTELFSLPLLEQLRVDDNKLTGALPSLSHATKLKTLDVSKNQLSALPDDFQGLEAPEFLNLSRNQFGGPIPPSIVSLQSLRVLYLDRNKFSGRVPPGITTLTNLNSGYGLAIDENALTTDDAAVKAFLDAKNGGWDRTQTVAPSDVRVTAQRERSITLNWTPILFSNGPGGYQIAYAESAAGPYSVLTTTPDKQTQAFIADGLLPSRNYFFTLTAVSYPDGDQQNVVASVPTAPIATSTTAGQPAPASVVVFAYPSEIRQRPGQSGTSSYVIGNVGDLPATISLSQKDDFFTQDPSSFTLGGGETKEIILTGKPLAAGAYATEARISGTGVPAGLAVRVMLLVTEPPAGTVSALPSQNRVDVAAPATSGATGSVDFENTGTATLQGVVISNVAWIIPPDGLIVIPPHEKRTVTFTVDQSKRPDADSPAGAVIGTLSLVYESGTVAGKNAITTDTTSTSVSTSITVVFTIAPAVQSATFPPLAPGEVALFVPGVGYVKGAAGLYISDVAILNAFGVESPTDIKMFYSPANAALPSKVTEVTKLLPSQGVTFGNVISSVFQDSSLGSLQIRSKSVDQLFVNANIFNVSNAGGTYGTALPIFRSDRALGPGESVFLTGLRRDAERTTYTNLFIQETSGQTAKYEIEFFDAAGKTAGEKKVGAVSPFRLLPITDTPADPAVPVGAVAARITNAADSTGRIVAFATPLDAQSLDFWTVADWNHEFDSPNDQPVIIPVAGSIHGSLDTFFRTDVSLTNRSAAAAGGSFVFYDAGGTTATRELSLGPGESATLNDIVGSSFAGIGSGLGYLEFLPRDGGFSLSSRTFATTPGAPGTYGTGVPVLPRSAALRLGQSRTIAGLEVASQRTIAAAKPGTFRSNIGLVETSGKPVTVQVTVIYNDIKQLVSGIRLTTLTYQLAPHQSMIKGIVGELQATNPNVPDLRDVQLKFQVTAGEGSVIVYVSSVDNGTADQVMRIN